MACGCSSSGSFIAGPFSGQLLGDYGADVIKIEPPGEGDPMRRWGITLDGDSLWWPAIARNKRSVTLDLRDERARQVVRRLAAACDIVIENFRPGRLDEWGLGYDVLAAANPALVLVHISRLRPDRARGPARPGSAASARPWAGSATRRAAPTARRRAPASASATPSPPCSA